MLFEVHHLHRQTQHSNVKWNLRFDPIRCYHATEQGARPCKREKSKQKLRHCADTGVTMPRASKKVGSPLPLSQVIFSCIEHLLWFCPLCIHEISAELGSCITHYYTACLVLLFVPRVCPFDNLITTSSDRVAWRLGSKWPSSLCAI